MIAHARDPVAPPSRVRPDIPEDLERVVLRCLAKDPTERFPDAASLERALARAPARAIGPGSGRPVVATMTGRQHRTQANAEFIAARAGRLAVATNTASGTGLLTRRMRRALQEPALVGMPWPIRVGGRSPLLQVDETSGGEPSMPMRARCWSRLRPAIPGQIGSGDRAPSYKWTRPGEDSPAPAGEPSMSC